MELIPPTVRADPARRPPDAREVHAAAEGAAPSGRGRGILIPGDPLRVRPPQVRLTYKTLFFYIITIIIIYYYYYVT